MYVRKKRIKRIEKPQAVSLSDNAEILDRESVKHCILALRFFNVFRN